MSQTVVMFLMLLSFAAGWIVSLVQNSYPLKMKIRVLQSQLKSPTWTQESRLAQEVTLRRLHEQASSKEARK